MGALNCHLHLLPQGQLEGRVAMRFTFSVKSDPFPVGTMYQEIWKVLFIVNKALIQLLLKGIEFP